MRAQGWNRKAFAWLAVGLVVAVLCMGLALNAEKIARAIGQLGPRPTTGEVDEGVVSAVPAAPVRDVGYTSWDAEIYPQYYRVVGQAVVDLDIPAGETWYAPLDELGRARRAAGTIDAATMEAGIARERGDLSAVSPSGWGHNAETVIEAPNGNDYHGYFWNRSHLLAKSLGGSDEPENLICGTRMQNVGANDGEGGMAYAEGLARDWLDAHPEGTVFFSAIPAYEGDEPVCRSVIVDVRSSDGVLDFELEVYNAARGHEIDYTTGEFY